LVKVLRTAEEFREQAKARNIKRWPIHDCSMCGYECGYLFNEAGEVAYDSGCDCVLSLGDRISPREWENVAEHYNMQSSENYIKEMDEFWGFVTKN